MISRSKLGVANGVFGIGSTALSGLSNVFVQLLVAAMLTPTGFGEFTVAATTIILAVGLARAAVGQLDMVRGLPDEPKGPTSAGYLVATVLICLGIPVTVLGNTWGSVTLQMVGYGLLASFVFALQDNLRYRCFRTRRAGVALLSDAIVLSGVVVGLVVLGEGNVSPTSALIAWSIATVCGLLVGGAILRYIPSSFGHATSWLVAHRDLVVPAIGEYSIQAALPYALNFVILGLGGFDALAGYRLAQVLFAVVSNLATGLNNVTLPHVVDSASPRRARRVYHLESVIVLVAGVVLLAAVLGIPTEPAVRIFGETWISMLAFAWAGAIHGIANALAVPTFSLTRLLGLATFSFWVRVGSAVVTLGGAVGAALALDAVAVAWALALPAMAAYVVRWVRCEVVIGQLVETGASVPVNARGTAAGSRDAL